MSGGGTEARDSSPFGFKLEPKGILAGHCSSGNDGRGSLVDTSERLWAWGLEPRGKRRCPTRSILAFLRGANSSDSLAKSYAAKLQHIPAVQHEHGPHISCSHDQGRLLPCWSDQTVLVVVLQVEQDVHDVDVQAQPVLQVSELSSRALFCAERREVSVDIPGNAKDLKSQLRGA